MSAPTLAASVLLVRGGTDVELFFVKRPARSGFMGNTYVFPGGKRDASDLVPRLQARLRGLDTKNLVERMQGVGSEEEARALVLTALRETFEESGVLLALHADGRPVNVACPMLGPRIREGRQRVHAGELSFLAFLEA